ncbi:MAG: hypothetical protein ACD_15C00237G0002 [uncultured bacterium]|nr:MAG: hypothetical protein ACD_15C00237G0002 [uncultured bacterium]
MEKSDDSSLIKILMLEHPVVLRLFISVINKNIYQIEETSIGKFALELIKNKSYDVLIADMEDQVFSEISQIASDKKIYIIGLSDFDENYARKKFSTPCNYFIQKPFSLDTFYEGLRQATKNWLKNELAE